MAQVEDLGVGIIFSSKSLSKEVSFDLILEWWEEAAIERLGRTECMTEKTNAVALRLE